MQTRPDRLVSGMSRHVLYGEARDTIYYLITGDMVHMYSDVSEHRMNLLVATISAT